MEMTPLIDVVFLLLTYFVFALVLMIRADVLDLTLPSLGAGRPAQPGEAITIAVDQSGTLFVNGEPAPIESLVTQVQSKLEQNPDATIYVALDTEGRVGPGLAVIDALMAGGITKFSMIGRPPSEAPTPSQPTPTQPSPAQPSPPQPSRSQPTPPPSE